MASVKCLWSEGAKLLAHGLESFGKIFDRFAVNFQRVGVDFDAFWSHFQKGSLEKLGGHVAAEVWYYKKA